MSKPVALFAPSLLLVLISTGAAASAAQSGYEGLPAFDPDGTPLLRPDGSSNASLLPWEDYAAHIQKRSGIAALGANVFGDSVSLYTGALNFSLTDVDLPGNFALPVAITRSVSIGAKPDYYLFDQALADWSLDLPHIGGTYAWVDGGVQQWPLDRCSDLTGPGNAVVGATVYQETEYWQGLHVQVPGGGELLVADTGAPRPTDTSYKWVTPGFTYLRCLPSIQNGTGEGFEAITADGTRYRFDWMAQNYEAPLEQPVTPPPNAAALQRRRNVLYATLVTDRYGNTVSYSYSNAWNAPVKLDEINASDGRRITLGWTAGRLTSVSANGRTWSYAYNAQGTSLTSVTLPDQRSWAINLQPLTGATIDFARGDPRSCSSPSVVLGPTSLIGSVTHPSGVVGQFEIGWRRLGRSNVPQACANWEFPVNDPNNDVAFFVRDIDVLPLLRKTVSGPSITAHQWNYAYGATRSWAPGTGPVCNTPTCADPVCLNDSCAGNTVVTVTGPDGEWQRYRFGNSYRYNEGKLLEVQRGNSETDVLETEAITYNLSQSGQPFATPVGTSLRARGDGFADAYLRPRSQSIVTRQGTTFTWQATAFDAFARVTAETHSSSLGHTRNVTQSFEDRPGPWVVGLPRIRTVNGLAERDLRYNTAALVEHEYRFGERRVSFGYRADGTIETVTDGRNLVTTANDWKRGLPQEVVYPLATGVRRATVDDNGWVTSITDETANVRSYLYDPLGRITSITYPAGWAPTAREFAPIQHAEYGIPAGSWKQTIATGNYRKHIWFDALWRPILEREWDATDAVGTQRFVRRGYDLRFNENFVSFAASSINTINDLGAGTTTQFDRLNRRTTVSTPSELGVLTTSYVYEPGFETRVINPRGYEQRLRYQAFDRPTEDFPSYVASGVNGQPTELSVTDIVRDPWGKVLSMRRTGNGADATRSYTYDARQRLCQLTEPESGALVMDYDAAGNLWWSAEGRTCRILPARRAGL